jgi:hypothetical protein
VNTILCKLVTPEQAISYNPSLPVWYNPVWMNALAKLHKIAPRVLICFKNDNPIAFLPLYEKRFVTLKKAYNPLLVYYSPLFFNLPERKKSNRNLLLEYEAVKCMADFLNATYKRVVLNLNPRQEDIRGFRDAGFKLLPQYTFIQDLTTDAEFFLGEEARLRKARTEGYNFSRKAKPEEHLELVYKMYQRKQHPFLSDRAALLKLIAELLEKGLVEQYNVWKDDLIVSSMLIIAAPGNTAYGWMTASNPQEMKKGASLFMFSELFKALAEQYVKFDMCGANSRGPSRLKAALGADLELFFQVVK